MIATATDVDGNVGTATADLKVRDLSDTGSARRATHGPPSGTVLSQPATIIGTVNDSNLDDYQLTLQPIGSSNSIVLAERASRTSIMRGTLWCRRRSTPARLETAGPLPLQLTATNIGGHEHHEQPDRDRHGLYVLIVRLANDLGFRASGC